MFPRSYNITKSVQTATLSLKNDISSVGKSLAVMYLYSFGFTDIDFHRHSYLHCSIIMLKKNIGVNTPLHIYLWVPENSIHAIPEHMISDFANVIIMPIDPDSWQLEGLDYSKFIGHEIHNIDYYKMGRWRLTFQHDFVRAMGYPYVLQIDDDSYVTSPVHINIVDHFSSRSIAWGLRRNTSPSNFKFIWGLAEFTK